VRSTTELQQRLSIRPEKRASGQARAIVRKLANVKLPLPIGRLGGIEVQWEAHWTSDPTT